MKPGQVLHLRKRVVSSRQGCTMTVYLTKNAHLSVLVLGMHANGMPTTEQTDKELEVASRNWATCCFPLEQWDHEDGPVLWWKFPVDEPPYSGTPNDSDWPGYHTHWTRVVVPVQP